MLLTLLIHKWFSYAQVICTVQEEEEEEENKREEEEEEEGGEEVVAPLENSWLFTCILLASS